MLTQINRFNVHNMFKQWNTLSYHEVLKKKFKEKHLKYLKMKNAFNMNLLLSFAKQWQGSTDEISGAKFHLIVLPLEKQRWYLSQVFEELQNVKWYFCQSWHGSVKHTEKSKLPQWLMEVLRCSPFRVDLICKCA